MKLLHPELRAPSAELDTRSPTLSAVMDLGTRLKGYLRRSPTPPVGGKVDSAEILLRTVERDVLPRLLSSLQDAQARSERARARTEIGVEDHVRFLETVRFESAASTRRFVQALVERGVTHEAVFLDLLTNAARRLGELWEADLSDFSEGTLGLCRLHQVLREMGAYHDMTECPSPGAPRVLLASAPGDQHLLGVLIVAEFFRRDGWRVRSEPGASRRRLAALVAQDRFDVLGLSVSRGDATDEVACTICDLREASRNPALKVLVGGRAFAETPELLEALGADALAEDARAAPPVALGLMARGG